MSDRPAQRPEGELIAKAQKRARLSNREAAKRAGISEARWRHIISGYRSEAGQHVPVSGPADTIARMAQVVGATPEQLAEVGREDAAEAFREIVPPQEPGLVPMTRDELIARANDLMTEAQEYLRRARETG